MTRDGKAYSFVEDFQATEVFGPGDFRLWLGELSAVGDAKLIVDRLNDQHERIEELKKAIFELYADYSDRVDLEDIQRLAEK